MSILDVIRHKCNEHSRRAVAEGRGFERDFLALLMELLEMNFNDLQGKANALLDKMSQLEADTKDLVAKSGGTVAQTPQPGTGTVVTDDQLNTLGGVLDNLGTRLDALKDEVVNGTAKPPSDTPPAQSSPTDTTTPPPSSGTPEPMPNPPGTSEPPTPTPTVTPGPGPTTAATSATGNPTNS